MDRSINSSPLVGPDPGPGLPCPVFHNFSLPWADPIRPFAVPTGPGSSSTKYRIGAFAPQTVYLVRESLITIP